MIRAVLYALALASADLAIAADAPDPNAYLEEVRGARALATVRRWNARTDVALATGVAFADYRRRARALLDDDARIATPDMILGMRVFNLWRDAAHPRGLWRVSPLAAFAAGRPDWRVLIDVDALGRAEGRSWVFGGATCRAPAFDRCMVALSDGGSDAAVSREFDMAGARFVADGFALPVAKSSVVWAGPDALYVATDFGPGSRTVSGYPRLVKLWRRGTPLAAATLVAEAPADEVELSPRLFVDGARTWPMLLRAVRYFDTRFSHIAPDGRIVPSPLPPDADVETVLDGRMIARLGKAWRGFPAGALVAYAIDDLLAGRPARFELVLAPSATQAIEQVGAARAVLWVKLLDDVSGRLVALRRDSGGVWQATDAGLPDKATIDLEAQARESDIAFAAVEGMLTPPTLYAVLPGAEPAKVQALPSRFDAGAMAVTQRFATSRDGTRIPYLLVRRKDAHDPAPALIHAYGGFRLAQTPTYLVDQPYRAGPTGLFWVEEGNAYVLANLRGGGEYGPAWHDAALREKRQNAYDDLHAVAEDLIRTGVSAPRRIAVSGRSNGGLLAAVAITQRPDLYGAAVIGSPLTDMKRYSHLLAGASWISEYGDPDKPVDWAFMSLYSPYQRLRPGVRYPVPLIYTSTEDDRVHPGHARKFAARLERLGDPFYYHEAMEGGHAAGADRREDALRAALIITYLNHQLPMTARR